MILQVSCHPEEHRESYFFANRSAQTCLPAPLHPQTLLVGGACGADHCGLRQALGTSSFGAPFARLDSKVTTRLGVWPWGCLEDLGGDESLVQTQTPLAGNHAPDSSASPRLRRCSPSCGFQELPEPSRRLRHSLRSLSSKAQVVGLFSR